MIGFQLDGAPVEVPDGGSLLDALREHLGVRSVKDGCSPQGQCGCCTVWIDGSPRVACVTPVARVSGRAVTTVDGLPDADVWATAFATHGASQCGFCTPGIIVRLAALSARDRGSPTAVRSALLAHLCRCTGWQTVLEATAAVHPPADHDPGDQDSGDQDRGGAVAALGAPSVTARAVRRAEIEGGVAQSLGPAVARGQGGFADDHAPDGALVAVRRRDGSWAVGQDLAEARAASDKVQGRRTTAPIGWPLEVPPGDWARTLRTTWVEPAYLEPDAAWCEPGGEPAGPLGNGGAFGGKLDTEVSDVARHLAAEHGRAVRVLSTREDVVRLGPKRPPMAVGIRPDGTGLARVVRTPGIVEAIHSVAPGIEVEEVDVVGPRTSVALRAAGWAEVAAMIATLADGPECVVTSPDGAVAAAQLTDDGAVRVRVRCGVDPDDPLEPVIARSYCIGAAHMALGWVRSEALAVDEHGVPIDLTIRSFGVLRAVDTPPVHVEFDAQPDAQPDALPDDGPDGDIGGAGHPEGPVRNGSDAVFAAVAAAAWRHAGLPAEWPTGRSAEGRT